MRRGAILLAFAALAPRAAWAHCHLQYQVTGPGGLFYQADFGSYQYLGVLPGGTTGQLGPDVSWSDLRMLEIYHTIQVNLTATDLTGSVACPAVSLNLDGPPSCSDDGAGGPPLCTPSFTVTQTSSHSFSCASACVSYPQPHAWLSNYYPGNSPAPAVSSLAPHSSIAGAPSLAVEIRGSGFVGASQARWNGSPLTTVWVDSSSVLALIPSSLLASTGTSSVTVLNPGGPSSPLAFAVLASSGSAPGPAAYSNVSPNMLQANWTANGYPAGTSYSAVLSTEASPESNGDAGNQAVLTTSLLAAFSNLNANTSYYVNVQAIGSAFAALGLIVTSAAPPAAAAFTGVSTNSLVANWNAGANPAGTLYRAVLSTATSPETNGDAGNQTVTTTNLWAAFAGLAAARTYYVEVQAVNNNNIGSAFTALGSAVTFPAATPAPSNTALSAVYQSSITATWTAVGSNGYTLEVSTVSNFSNAIASAAASGAAASLTGVGLAFNTTYYLRVGAVWGASAVYSSTLSACTLAAMPAAPAVAGVTTNAANFSWSGSGNPAYTLYELSVATDAAFAAVIATRTAAQTSLAVSGLFPATTYYARVRAFNGGQVPTPFLLIGPMVTDADPSVSFLNFPVLPSAYTFSLPPPNNMVRLTLPPNAFGAPVILYASNDPLNHPLRVSIAALETSLLSPPNGQSLVPGSLLEIVPLLNGVPFSGNLGSSATLSLPYADGTNPPIQAAALGVYTLDTALLRWVALPSVVDPVGHRVSALTPHFSIFALFGPTGVSLSAGQTRAFPNPWKIGSAGRFDAPGITFDRLPLQGTIRIFNLSGQRIALLSFSGVDAGRIVWTGESDAGKSAASGVYFADIRPADGTARAMIKFAIER